MINGSPTNRDTLHGAYHYDAWGLPQGTGSYATGIWTQSTSLITSTLAGQIASYSTQAEHPFRRKPNTDSAPSRTPRSEATRLLF